LLAVTLCLVTAIKNHTRSLTLKLFEPARIGSLFLKNRIIMPPMATLLVGAAAESENEQRAIDYHEARAIGGTGLIIIGAMRLNSKLEAVPGDLVISDEKCIRWLHNVAKAVHSHGTKVGLCISPGFGRNMPPNPDLPNGGLISASAVPAKWNTDVICRALTTGEIEQLMEDIEAIAKTLSSIGIDLIDLHAHCGYLIDEFLTPLWNKRTDEYGGDLDGRLKFSMDLIEAVKRGAGKDFPICYRYSLTHYLDGGRTVDEGIEIARRLEKAGVDVIGVDAGCYETMHWSQPTTTQLPGCLVPLAEMVKKVVNVPVIAVGKLGDPALAEKVLKEGKADFIALGRALIADPDWPKKVREGKVDDITPCLACHEGCLKRVSEGKEISCAVNPACGRENEWTINPASRKKTVLVIGGGPAGMEAARVAALRGHRVTLLEKKKNLGGNLIPASIL
jgi:2-enoate reductase